MLAKYLAQSSNVLRRPGQHVKKAAVLVLVGITDWTAVVTSRREELADWERLADWAERLADWEERLADWEKRLADWEERLVVSVDVVTGMEEEVVISAVTDEVTDWELLLLSFWARVKFGAMIAARQINAKLKVDVRMAVCQ